jgi:hypothetical protein
MRTSSFRGPQLCVRRCRCETLLRSSPPRSFYFTPLKCIYSTVYDRRALRTGSVALFGTAGKVIVGDNLNLWFRQQAPTLLQDPGTFNLFFSAGRNLCKTPVRELGNDYMALVLRLVSDTCLGLASLHTTGSRGLLLPPIFSDFRVRLNEGPKRIDNRDGHEVTNLSK